MRKAIKLICIFLIIFVLIGCDQVTENERISVVEFEGNVYEVVNKLESYGFRIYFASGSLVNNGISLIDKQGYCYDSSFNLVECYIDVLEKVNIAIFFRNETLGTIMESSFWLDGRGNFYQMNANILIFGEFFGGFYGYNFMNHFDFATGSLYSIRTNSILQTADAQSVIVSACSLMGPPVCNAEEQAVLFGMRNVATELFIGELGFDSFYEVAAFLRAYFYEYALPFMNELVSEFN